MGRSSIRARSRAYGKERLGRIWKLRRLGCWGKSGMHSVTGQGDGP